MRITAALALTIVLATLPASAIDFLGVELCDGSIDTRVTMPPGSSLVLESAEIGDNGSGKVVPGGGTGVDCVDHSLRSDGHEIEDRAGEVLAVGG